MREQKSSALREVEGKAHSPSLTRASTIKFLRQTYTYETYIEGNTGTGIAQLVVGHCLDTIIVSNYGGRQLDCVPSTIQALPGIVEAVGGRIPMILDGGIRRGTEVFKAHFVQTL